MGDRRVVHRPRSRLFALVRTSTSPAAIDACSFYGFNIVPANVAGQVTAGTLRGILYDKTPAAYLTPDVRYLLIDRQVAWQRFEANRSAFTTTNQIGNDAADDFRDLETTKAVYAQGLFRADRFDVQAGLRYDSTHLVIDTNQAPTVRGATAYEPVRRTTDYDYWPPSALATYQLGDGMRVASTAARKDRCGWRPCPPWRYGRPQPPLLVDAFTCFPHRISGI